VIEQREPSFLADDGEKFLYPRRPISAGTILADNNPSCSLPFCAPSPDTQTDNCITYCCNPTHYNVRPPVASDAVSRRSTGSFGSFHAPLCEFPFLLSARFGIIGFLSNIAFHIGARRSSPSCTAQRELQRSSSERSLRSSSFASFLSSRGIPESRGGSSLLIRHEGNVHTLDRGFERKPRERGI